MNHKNLFWYNPLHGNVTQKLNKLQLSTSKVLGKHSWKPMSAIWSNGKDLRALGGQHIQGEEAQWLSKMTKCLFSSLYFKRSLEQLKSGFTQ